MAENLPLPRRNGIKAKAAAPQWYKSKSRRAAVLYKMHVAAVLLHLDILKTLSLSQ